MDITASINARNLYRYLQHRDSELLVNPIFQQRCSIYKNVKRFEDSDEDDNITNSHSPMHSSILDTQDRFHEVFWADRRASEQALQVLPKQLPTVTMTGSHGFQAAKCSNGAQAALTLGT